MSDFERTSGKPLSGGKLPELHRIVESAYRTPDYLSCLGAALALISVVAGILIIAAIVVGPLFVK